MSERERLRELRDAYDLANTALMDYDGPLMGEKAGQLATVLQNAKRAYFDAMHNALPSLLSETAAPLWHPIETAPKDGTNIFLAEPDAMGIGYWDDQDEEFRDFGGFPITFATHWMPLPTSPSQSPAASDRVSKRLEKAEALLAKIGEWTDRDNPDSYICDTRNDCLDAIADTVAAYLREQSPTVEPHRTENDK